MTAKVIRASVRSPQFARRFRRYYMLPSWLPEIKTIIEIRFSLFKSSSWNPPSMPYVVCLMSVRASPKHPASD